MRSLRSCTLCFGFIVPELVQLKFRLARNHTWLICSSADWSGWSFCIDTKYPFILSLLMLLWKLGLTGLRWYFVSFCSSCLLVTSAVVFLQLSWQIENDLHMFSRGVFTFCATEMITISVNPVIWRRVCLPSSRCGTCDLSNFKVTRVKKVPIWPWFEWFWMITLFEFVDDYETLHRDSKCIEEDLYCFSRSSVKF